MFGSPAGRCRQPLGELKELSSLSLFVVQASIAAFCLNIANYKNEYSCDLYRVRSEKVTLRHLSYSRRKQNIE
jgi:hypothetical protein